jgi:hypothetical protein
VTQRLSTSGIPNHGRPSRKDAPSVPKPPRVRTPQSQVTPISEDAYAIVVDPHPHLDKRFYGVWVPTLSTSRPVLSKTHTELAAGAQQLKQRDPNNPASPAAPVRHANDTDWKRLHNFINGGFARRVPIAELQS